MQYPIIALLLASLCPPAALGADTHTVKSSLVNWREAQPATSESELDRLNRAFVQLAKTSRPAIVQIRVSGPENSQNQTSRGSGFSSIRKATS